MLYAVCCMLKVYAESVCCVDNACSRTCGLGTGKGEARPCSACQAAPRHGAQEPRGRGAFPNPHKDSVWAAGWSLISILSFVLTMKSVTGIHVYLEQRLHFPTSLATGYGHVTKFRPIAWKHMCHVAASGKLPKGQLVYDFCHLFFPPTLYHNNFRKYRKIGRIIQWTPTYPSLTFYVMLDLSFIHPSF